MNIYYNTSQFVLNSLFKFFKFRWHYLVAITFFFQGITRESPTNLSRKPLWVLAAAFLIYVPCSQPLTALNFSSSSYDFYGKILKFNNHFSVYVDRCCMDVCVCHSKKPKKRKRKNGSRTKTAKSRDIDTQKKKQKANEQTDIH